VCRPAKGGRESRCEESAKEADVGWKKKWRGWIEEGNVEVLQKSEEPPI